jgi:hypothetical protein
MKISLYAVLLTVTSLLPVSLSAQSLSYTNFTATATASGLNNYVNLALNKFDTSLGTLEGVTITVNYATLGGSFLLAAPDPNLDQTVNSASGRITIRQATTNSLGFSQIGETTNAVTTTPSLPFTVVGAGSQVFSVAQLTALTNISQTISNSFWSAYSSPGGVGDIIFQVKNRPDIDVEGGVFTLDGTEFTVDTSMTVTYSYIIPEPSTYALITLAALGIAGYQWRRRHTQS